MFPAASAVLRAVIAMFVLCMLPPTYAFDSPQSPQVATGTLQALFSPWDNIEGAIVSSVKDAKKQVLVQAYLLTNGKIASALLAAKRHGVDVQILMDAKQIKRGGFSKAALLVSAGIPVWLESKYQNAHNKTIVIDPGTSDSVVITGSFNFTWAAQNSNSENVLIVRKNPQLAARYAQNWQRHRQDAVAYKDSNDTSEPQTNPKTNPKNSKK